MNDPQSDEFDAEAMLGRGLAKAAEDCRDNAEDSRSTATALRAVSDTLRSLISRAVKDPETHEVDPPALLNSPAAQANARIMCDKLDQITVEVYGIAGVWDAEVEAYAARILEHQAVVHEPDPWEPRTEA